MARLYLILTLATILSIDGYTQTDSSILTQDEVRKMYESFEADSSLAQTKQWFGDPLENYVNFKKNLIKADSVWTGDQKRLQKIDDIGTTKTFEFIPVAEWFSENEELAGKEGVSYLLKTDEATILFDLGFNSEELEPSPLLMNMKKLGVELKDIDVIVLSHNHSDHVGGFKWESKNTFSLTNHQIDLKGIKVYTPATMTYPGLEPVYAHDPVKIAEGVATIGVIPSPMFFTYDGEQAIAVNVKDKGIIIITGCGHQTVEKIIKRSELLFDEPIYGILGGYHLPITIGRNIEKFQQYFCTGRLPWKPFTMEDVNNNILLMKKKGVKIAGVSAHDSCDDSINAFKEAYRDSYEEIKVGRSIAFK